MNTSAARDVLTERQQHEVEYHRRHAQRLAPGERVNFDILRRQRRSWWNASWTMYTAMLAANPAGQRVLVVGCGFGEDAIRLASLGARVSAFDLSPEVLSKARALASRHGVAVDFAEMAAESLDYPDDRFDWIVVRDILHHVEIDAAMGELARVARGGARLFANEVYSHAWTNGLRHSRFVNNWLYPRVVGRIYEGRQPYITPDERKCDQRDIAKVARHLKHARARYFSFLSGRLVAPSNATFARADRAMLKLAGPAGRYLGGRIVLTGEFRFFDKR